MAPMYGSARRTTHAWLNAPLHETRLPNTNRFLPLADMPPSADELPSTPPRSASHLRKKKKTTSRRKRLSRGMKHSRPVDKDDIDLAFASGPPYGEALMWEELPETYVPHLGIMLNETVTLDCLPRASPPVTVRPDKRRAKRREDGDRFEDWDLVSNCSEESFFMV